jgi:hypothetical protein
MEKVLYQKLKCAFLDWCSFLSLDECASNQELLLTIEQVESLLNAVTE